MEMVVITDAGRDHDDELALAVLCGLERIGFVRLKAVVVNLSSDDRRARLVKGALQALHFSDDVPVAIGSDDSPDYQPKHYEYDVGYMGPEGSVEFDGQALLTRVFQEASARGTRFHLCLLSGMTDARDFIRDNRVLAAAAIKQCCIMGGVEVAIHGVVSDDRGHFVPDTAYNNRVDRHLNHDPNNGAGPAAKELYRFLQEANIPTVIVSRNTAYAAAVTPSFYQELAVSGHPVALRLMRDQKAAIENLWENVQHATMGPCLNIEWFITTFCVDTDRARRQLHQVPTDPWSVVDSLNLYDPIAVLMAVLPESLGLFSKERFAIHRIL